MTAAELIKRLNGTAEDLTWQGWDLPVCASDDMRAAIAAIEGLVKLVVDTRLDTPLRGKSMDEHLAETERLIDAALGED